MDISRRKEVKEVTEFLFSYVFKIYLKGLKRIEEKLKCFFLEENINMFIFM